MFLCSADPTSSISTHTHTPRTPSSSQKKTPQSMTETLKPLQNNNANVGAQYNGFGQKITKKKGSANKGKGVTKASTDHDLSQGSDEGRATKGVPEGLVVNESSGNGDEGDVVDWSMGKQLDQVRSSERGRRSVFEMPTFCFGRLTELVGGGHLLFLIEKSEWCESGAGWRASGRTVERHFGVFCLFFIFE